MINEHTLLEDQVLAAVQVLGQPTTIEVAERCHLDSRATRAILNRLSVETRVQARGRRWIVPSVALVQMQEDRFLQDPGPEGCCSKGGCGWIIAVATVFITLFWWGAYSCTSRVFAGWR